MTNANGDRPILKKNLKIKVVENLNFTVLCFWHWLCKDLSCHFLCSPWKVLQYTYCELIRRYT